MIKDNFWFITLLALFVIFNVSEPNIFLRIALAANAIVVLVDVTLKMMEIINGYRKKKN